MSATKIKKYDNWVWVIFALCGLSVFAIAILIYLIGAEKNALLKDGIKQDVIVLDKFRRGTIKQPTFHMKVAWFDGGEEIPVYKSQDTTGMSKDEKFSETVLSEVFDGVTRTNLGDYNAFQLKYINGDSYQNLKIGDVATLIYLEGKVEDGRLLREIDKKHKNKHKKSEL